MDTLISRTRRKNLENAQRLEKEGNIEDAQSYYYKALEISPELYSPLIDKLRENNIPYIVAPYEGDAELGFLFRNNYIDLAITEDSDSLVYGCRCVLFKLDKGVGREIDMSRLNNCTRLDFCGWTHDMFTYMCILSGCDYLPNLPGVGIKTAYKAVSRGIHPTQIFEYLRSKTVVPETYEAGFTRAVFTFRHQTVFDPQLQTTVPLMPYPPSLATDPPLYLGPLLQPELAARVARGEVDPTTYTPVEMPEEAMEEENQESQSEVHFTSPFISISFKALIEKPSERGLPKKGDLSHLSLPQSTESTKRRMVIESPPRKRPTIQNIGPSPVENHCVNSFLDQFRMSINSGSYVFRKQLEKLT